MIWIVSFIDFLVLVVSLWSVWCLLSEFKLRFLPARALPLPPALYFCLLLREKPPHMLPHVARLKLSLLNALSINFIENCFTSGLPSLCGIPAPKARF